MGRFKTSSPQGAAKDRARTDWTKQTLAIECKDDNSEPLVDSIRLWIKSTVAHTRFGPHIKFIESLTSTPPLMQKCAL